MKVDLKLNPAFGGIPDFTDGKDKKDERQGAIMKKGSWQKGLIVCILTVIAVVLISFAVKYFQGG